MSDFSRDSSTPRRGALGKGLNSLLGLGGDIDQAPDSGGSTPGLSQIDQTQLLRVPIAAVRPNPQQPRKIMQPEALAALAKSVAEDGIIQPIIVRRGEVNGEYLLVAGERRWRAAGLAGLTEVPVIVKEIATSDLLRIALIENVQRSDLNIIEEAQAYAALIEEHGLTQEQCAKRIGKERSSIANTLRLLDLPSEIQDDLCQERLSMGHGRALLAIDDKVLILRAREIVLQKSLNVRQTEGLCKRLVKPESGQSDDSADESPSAANADLDYLAERLRSELRTKIRFVGTGTRGKIEISYFSNAELDRIIAEIAPKLV